MNAALLVDSLARFPDVLDGLLRDHPVDRARWRPAGGGWSILEIARHLLDEEREDFRTRLELTLRDTDRAWPAIDPEGWVLSRDYAGADLEEVRASFRTERQASVEWLRGLGNVDWKLAHAHPALGTLRAGDLLFSWTVHDALHLRQLARRLYELAERDAEGFAPDYAGRWSG